MRKTGFYAKYGLFDTTARDDSTLTTASNQDFGSIEKAKDDIESEDYATLEEDYFLLDGSMPEMPDNPDDAVYFSTELSGADGAFTDPPSFTISEIFFSTESRFLKCSITYHIVTASNFSIPNSETKSASGKLTQLAGKFKVC